MAYGVRSQTMLCSVVSLRTEVNTNFPNVPLVVTIEQTTDLVNCSVTAARPPPPNTIRAAAMFNWTICLGNCSEFTQHVAESSINSL